MVLGPIMLDLKGTQILPEEREMLLHPLTGGVILFTRNFESIEQVTELVTEIHSVRQPHLLVAVDHEGGRVQRFRKDMTELPAVALLGEEYNKDKNKAKALTEMAGWLMAAECRSLGVDFSFAPVLDVSHGLSGVIGDRAFHQNPEIIATLAQRYMAGMARAGMSAVGKHFPGHGGVKGDSHIEKPVDNRSLADIQMSDLLPFERMIHFGLAGIMPSHVVYPAIDSVPAGYSKIWLQTILREQLGFQGAIFSDELSMAGALIDGSTPTDRADMALQAGCDMVLLCNNPENTMQVLDELEYEVNPASKLRLVRMHGKKGMTRQQLLQSKEWRDAVCQMESIEKGATRELKL